MPTATTRHHDKSSITNETRGIIYTFDEAIAKTSLLEKYRNCGEFELDLITIRKETNLRR